VHHVRKNTVGEDRFFFLRVSANMRKRSISYGWLFQQLSLNAKNPRRRLRSSVLESEGISKE
jgi:hypothetical protein